MRVTIQDSRTLVGKLCAFDKHMNLVLLDTEEYRRIIPKGGKKGVEKVQKRMLGFIILRGEIIVSLTVEAPPTLSDSRVNSTLLNKNQPIGQGVPKQASRGITQPIVQGLQGPIPSFGTAPPKMMMPLQFGPPPTSGQVPQPNPFMSIPPNLQKK